MNMLQGVTIGQYYPLDSQIHKMDARFKIGMIFIYVIALFTASGPFAYSLLALFALAVIALSKIPFKIILKGLKPILWIIGFTLILHTFSTKEGFIVWQWSRFSIYSGGIVRGIMMGFRLILLLSITSLLTLTTTPIDLTDGLEVLLSPFKKLGLPAHELAMMMTIALRFVPTLIEEADKIIKAQTARGADFESGGFIARAKSLIPILVPLFISAFRRADDLAMAMEARCYRGGENRTKMKELKSGKRDYLGLSVMVLVFLLMLTLRITGFDSWQAWL
jgi:energy-coupling factor transport system permease protein